ncbi:hypothetical protein EB052_00710, partial [bacterium]|nr:hypothetical protein [bacterium]
MKRLYPRHIFLSVAVLFLALFLFTASPVFASWGGQPYVAGQTLNPECAPTDDGCTVATSTQPWTVATSTSNISYTSGNVGIGTNAPRTALDIVSGAGGVVPLITLQSNTEWYEQGPAIVFKDGLGSTSPTTAQIHTSSTGYGNAGLNFDVSQGYQSDSRLITALALQGATGFVGIGTTSSNHKLTVADNPATAVLRITGQPVEGDSFVLTDANGGTWGYEFDTDNEYNTDYNVYLVDEGNNQFNASQLIDSISNSIGNSGHFYTRRIDDTSIEIIQTTAGVAGNRSNSVSAENDYYNYTHFSNGFSLTNFEGASTGDINFTGNIYKNGSLYSGDSQWTSTSSDIYFSSGNVGIGTTTPSSALAVVGRSTFTDATSSAYDPNNDGAQYSGLYAEWWNNQESPDNPDYSLTPDVTNHSADPSQDLFATRPNNVNYTGIAARISGWIKPDYTETYTFCSNSDDGSLLYINDVLVVDNGGYHPPTQSCGTINLTADTWYPIKVIFFQGEGGANLYLSWASNSQGEGSIPMDHTTNNGHLVGAAVAPSISFFGGSTTTKKYIDITDSTGSSVFSVSSSTAAFAGNVSVGQAMTSYAPLEITKANEIGSRYYSILIDPAHQDGGVGARIAFQGNDGNTTSTKAAIIGETIGGAGDFSVYTSHNADFATNTADWKQRFVVTNGGLVGINTEMGAGDVPVVPNTLSVVGRESMISMTQLGSAETGTPARKVLVHNNIA